MSSVYRYVYRLKVEVPAESADPYWRPPGQEWNKADDMDLDGDPIPWRWPSRRLYLSSTSANRAAKRLREWGATVEIDRSDYLTWGPVGDRRRLELPPVDDAMSARVGYFDSREQTEPVYNPDPRGPCLICWKPMTAADIQTHSLLKAEDGRRSYFFRTHKTCAEGDPDHLTRIEHAIIDGSVT